MSLRENITVFLWAAIATMAIGAGRPAMATPIDWVRVGNPGNAADANGFGAVNHTYDIMKFSTTVGQYVAFLNAVDPQGINPNGIYDGRMGSASYGPSLLNTGGTDGSRYLAAPNWADKPVLYVSWYDAARFTNWLQNGAQTYGTSDASANAPQNVGAYTVGTATSGDAVLRNPGAQYWIPTNNEWYKAAYYSPVKGGPDSPGYYLYATQSDDAPTPVTASPTGVGSAGSTGNFANFNQQAVWVTRLNQPLGAGPTTVGTNGGPSYYGTFDMTGQVFNLTDDGPDGSLAQRGVIGSTWLLTTVNASGPGYAATNIESNTRGFRVAAVPEPSAYITMLSGLACAGYWLRRRRIAATARK
jgi:sulfatase modifying factor 1